MLSLNSSFTLAMSYLKKSVLPLIHMNPWDPSHARPTSTKTLKRNIVILIMLLFAQRRRRRLSATARRRLRRTRRWIRPARIPAFFLRPILPAICRDEWNHRLVLEGAVLDLRRTGGAGR